MFWQIWDWVWLHCRGLPTPFNFFSSVLPLHILIFWLFCPPPPRLVSFCLSLILLVSYSVLRTAFLCSHSVNFSCVDFSHCLLLFVPYCASFFPSFLCQSCWMFLVASCSKCLPSYALCYWCLIHTKGCSPGHDARQVSPSPRLDPWWFQIHKWQNRFIFSKVYHGNCS